MNCKIILTSLVGSLMIAGKTYAQDSLRNEKFNNLYLAAEFGKTNKGTFLIQGGVSVQIKNNYFKIKSSSLIERYEKDRRHKEDPVPGLYDIGFIIGKSYDFGEHHQLQVGTGASMVHQVVQQRLDEPGYYTYHNKYKNRYTVGLPVEVRYNFYINRGIALSCIAYGNANSLKSFTNASLGVMVGMF